MDSNTEKSAYPDVFLSYRRHGGSAIAILLKRRLEEEFAVVDSLPQDQQKAELNIFLDTEALESGKFAEVIESSIKKSSNFLLLLTPGCLLRCFENPETDFILREILTRQFNRFIKRHIEFLGV